MAADPTRAVVEAEDLWLLELEPDDELLDVCEELGLELVDSADALNRLAEADELALRDEAEAEADALVAEAEADANDGLDEDAAETILPRPQGIAGPSGCLA